MPKDAQARFWSKVNKDGPTQPHMDSCCWEWLGHINRYGRFGLDGTMKLAHRVAYEWTHGAIDSGQVVCHRCDNGACVRPDHLALGSQRDNMSDCVEKGRFSRRRGAQNPSAKMNPLQVRIIRRLFDYELSGAEVARVFSVDPGTAYNIKRGRSWRF
jgi:hypothetical protein